jgi:hypothetical protein
MFRSITVALAAAAAVSLAACGSGDPSAAGVRRRTSTAAGEGVGVPFGWGQQQFRGSRPGSARVDPRYVSCTHITSVDPSGAASKPTELLFPATKAGTLASLTRAVAVLLRRRRPRRLIVNGKVIVVYAAAGSDRGAAVERAVKSL